MEEKVSVQLVLRVRPVPSVAAAHAMLRFLYIGTWHGGEDCLSLDPTDVLHLMNIIGVQLEQGGFLQIAAAAELGEELLSKFISGIRESNAWSLLRLSLLTAHKVAEIAVLEYIVGHSADHDVFPDTTFEQWCPAFRLEPREAAEPAQKQARLADLDGWNHECETQLHRRVLQALFGHLRRTLVGEWRFASSNKNSIDDWGVRLVFTDRSCGLQYSASGSVFAKYSLTSTHPGQNHR